MRWGLWVNPADRAQGLARLGTAGIVKDVEADFRMKDGSIRTCLLGASIIEINGQPCALTALTDITDRKQAEAALQASEDQLRRVLDNITAFAGILTPDGQIVDINRAQRPDLTMANIQGRPFEEGYWFAYSPALQAQISASIKQAAAGATVRFDIKARIGPDHFLDVSYAIAPCVMRPGRSRTSCLPGLILPNANKPSGHTKPVQRRSDSLPAISQG